MNRRNLLVLAALLAVGLLLTACAFDSKATRVKRNIAVNADNFSVVGRLTVINTRNDSLLFENARHVLTL